MGSQNTTEDLVKREGLGIRLFSAGLMGDPSTNYWAPIAWCGLIYDHALFLSITWERSKVAGTARRWAAFPKLMLESFLVCFSASRLLLISEEIILSAAILFLPYWVRLH